MKNYIITSLTAIVTIFIFSLDASAVPARPTPINITQPDGSTLTIKMHGDEFLNWTTCGNSLVALGADGFYHYASFSPDGTSNASGARVITTPSGDGSSVRPPQSAITKAAGTRAEWREKAMNIRRAAEENYAVTGEDHYLVMLVDFKDLPFSVENAHDAFYRLLNEEGYSDFDGTGSVRDYYSDQSLRKFRPQFDVYGPYTVTGEMSTYSENNGTTQDGAPRLLAEACTMADTDIDFSQYDHDGDGYIDNVFMYYAGYCAASGNEGTIWPHAWAVYYEAFNFDGVYLYRYACASEYDGRSGSNLMASIGTYCHEFAHVIGLPDFYDTDYEEHGEDYGLGVYSLMSSGCYNNNEKTPPYFNCEERMLLGWMESVPSLPYQTTDITLNPLQNENGYISPTSNEGEYYYYEFRNQTGWDSPLKPGLLIYHVDKSDNIVDGRTARQRWENWDGINDYAEHPCFRLVRANPNKNITPFGGNYTEFSSETDPAAIGWDEEPTGYDLSNIQYNQEHATFHLSYGYMDVFYKKGICAIETTGDWKAGDKFTFKLTQIENMPSAVKWYFDGEQINVESITLTSGDHTIKAELSWDNGDKGYDTALIKVQ